MRTNKKTSSPVNDQQRNQLVEQHIGLLHHVARSLHSKLSTEASLDDLVSAGALGLMNAAESFDAARGSAFSTYALPRIRGAMLDDLRSQDSVSRSVRRKARELRAVREAVAQREGSAPDVRKVATELGVDVEIVWQWDADVASAQSVSLDRSATDDEGEGFAPCSFVADDEAADDGVLQAEMVDQLRAALAELPQRERQVLALYYFEELNQSQIAQILGVTESRVSQLRSQAIKRLRTNATSLQTLMAA